MKHQPGGSRSKGRRGSKTITPGLYDATMQLEGYRKSLSPNRQLRRKN